MANLTKRREHGEKLMQDLKAYKSRYKARVYMHASGERTKRNYVYHFDVNCRAAIAGDRTTRAVSLRTTEGGDDVIVLRPGKYLHADAIKPCVICEGVGDRLEERRLGSEIREWGSCNAGTGDVSHLFFDGRFAGTRGPEKVIADENATRALAICAECPVEQECRDYADLTEAQYGIWGGEPAYERKLRWKLG